MGTHISKVKSVDLDMWTPEQMAVSLGDLSGSSRQLTYTMQSVQKWGNKRANLYWEAHLKPGHQPPDQLRIFGFCWYANQHNVVLQQVGFFYSLQV